MSTQDTTLPPLPEPAMKASEGVCCGNYSGGAYYMGQQETICCGQPDEAWPDYFTTDQMHAYARAAIAAQAQPETERLREELKLCCELKREYQERAAQAITDLECPPDPDTVDRALAQEAQQAQGVPADFEQVAQALETAKSGLLWYQDRCKDAVDGSDDEAMGEIDRAIETCHQLAAAPHAEPVHKQSSDIRAVFEAWVEGYPIQIVEDDYEMCFDAFQAGYAVKAEPQPEREPARLETLHAWATSGEPPCNSFDKGYEAAREFVAMQLAGIGTKGGDK